MQQSDREIIEQSDWWCVVDYDIRGLSRILIRIGKKGNMVGEDYVEDVDDDDEAMALWLRFNRIQEGNAPSLKNLRIMSEDR